MKRSQLFTMDLIFTASVFVMLFFMFAVSLNDSLMQKDAQYRSMQARMYAEQIASLLTLSPGVPFTWHEGDMLYPGAVQAENQLSMDKIDTLLSLELNQTLQVPYPTAILLDLVDASGYTPVDCSQYLKDKYGGCTYTTEQVVSRLVYSDDAIYRLQVVVDG